MPFPTTALTHRSPPSRRQIRLAKTATAAEAIGQLEQGLELYVLTFGQFSISHALLHLLGQTGPAEMAIATWTAARADLTAAHRLLASKEITRLRWIVDRSFANRQPDYCRQLLELFGADCIRAGKSHAKFVLVRNARWNLVVRTSMNLNENPRLENLEISDHAALSEFMWAVVDEIFRDEEPGLFADKLPALELIPEMPLQGRIGMRQLPMACVKPGKAPKVGP